ncbi:MAG TPA: STAS domain-containing protein [Desulfobacterales bacterium]|jgi:anti-anti-sigma factor|nr:STAS domain-containing protein [Desulfobacterales bacterium]HSM89651.1 STAS domain-containing protein [Desulfobacterales bacterium]
MALKVNTSLKRPGIFVVAPIGSIDTPGQAIFQEKVDSLLSQNPDVVIFDMEFTEYINSMGIRVLVKAKKALKQRNGKVVFINLQPQIKKVFDILNALPSLKVFASIQELDAYLDAMQSKSR